VSSEPSPQYAEPAGPTSGPKTRPSPPRGRSGLLVAAAVGIVVGGAGVTIAVRSRTGASVERPVVVRDVPRVEGDTIVLSPSFRERAGITFAKAERVPFKPTVRVVGTVALNPSFVAAIGTRVRGTLRRTFKYEGDRVSANEPLAEIESAELGEAQSGVVQAEAALTAAEIQARRESELLDKGLTTAREAEVAQTELSIHRATLQAAQQRAKAFGGGAGFGVYVLRSPIAGHVVERNVSPGQSVDGTSVGYKVADLDHLWIELSVFERDLPAVHVGDQVEVRPLASEGVKLPGTVAHVGEVIHPVSRSADVRITVDHPKVHLRPGQSVEAVITSGAAEREALLIPHDAVAYIDGKPTVFVAEGDSRVRFSTVRLGASDGTRHEVLEGVEVGQMIATTGVFALKSELFR
jgi:cobalt-zinc-cadmium efflux system membrane fusion protein